MDKRTLLALGLILLVWIIWFKINPPKREVPKKDTSVTEEVATDKKDAADTKEVSSKKTPRKTVRFRKKSAGEPKEVTSVIESDKFVATLTNKGASIKSIKFKERKDVNGDFLELTVPKNPFKAKGLFDFPVHFDDDEFLNGSDIDDLNWSVATTKGNSVVYQTEVTIDNAPLLIQKSYSFDSKSYEFRVEYRFINNTNKDISLPRKKFIVSPSDMLGPKLKYSNTYNILSGIYSIDGEFEQAAKGGGFLSKGGMLNKETGNINWIGIMSRYMVIVVIPEDFTGNEMITDGRKEGGFRTGISVSLKKVKAGSEVVKPFKVYLGEKNKEKLGMVSESIVEAADVSKWIEPIRYFVNWSLMKFYGLFGNLGWALVLFSLLTKIVFMPLTIKSTESMKKMQALTPKINEIKAKYKDKPEMVQQETLALYREHKVNPLGGCFPMLLQMPFFFGLYSALIGSIDLWNAPFIFWMKDLSMPDTVATIAGYNLNILPILMTVSTFLQQKLTTVDTGQQQKIMMMMMPIVFIFIFWTMPSGLVLYWTLQNLFQVLHQLYVNKKKAAAA
jgi:YidC/Oxa1 family membrane protein insertase